MSFESFLRLLHRSYDQPQDTARWILSLNLPRRLALLALALVAVLTTFFALGMQQLAKIMAGGDPALANLPADPMASLMASPFAFAALQFGGMILGAVMIHRVGRLFGGHGTWDQTLPLVAWLQIVMMVLQLAQVLLVLALPILALPVILFAVFSVFFLTAHFTAALHGFASVGKVLGGIILTLVVVSFGLATLFLILSPVQHV